MRELDDGVDVGGPFVYGKRGERAFALRWGRPGGRRLVRRVPCGEAALLRRRLVGPPRGDALGRSVGRRARVDGRAGVAALRQRPATGRDVVRCGRLRWASLSLRRTNTRACSTRPFHRRDALAGTDAHSFIGRPLPASKRRATPASTSSSTRPFGRFTTTSPPTSIAKIFPGDPQARVGPEPCPRDHAASRELTFASVPRAARGSEPSLEVQDVGRSVLVEHDRLHGVLAVATGCARCVPRLDAIVVATAFARLPDAPLVRVAVLLLPCGPPELGLSAALSPRPSPGHEVLMNRRMNGALPEVDECGTLPLDVVARRPHHA